MNKFSKFLAVAVVLTTAYAPVGASAATGTNQAAASASVNFSDLDQVHDWAKDSILEINGLRILKGDTDGHLRPLANITRQEIAAVLSRALKLETLNVSKSSFSDVASDAWAKDYIDAVKQSSLMVGSDNAFRPNDLITREELAVVFARAAKLDVAGKAANLQVSDKSTVSDWAKDSVAAVMEQGLIIGDGENFNPKKFATREEVAVMTMRFVNQTAQPAVLESVSDNAVTIAGVTYQVSDQLKGILNQSNADVLKSSKVKFEATNHQLTKITSLELVNGGKAAAAGQAEFSGNLVLDGQNNSVNGDLKISADYITVKNLTVTGNFEIGKQLQNDFYSNNLQVSGKTVVSGGDTNTVVFENARLGAMTVSKPNVRVEPKGNTTVGDITVSSDASIVADSGVTIPKVTLGDGANQVEISANVTALDVTNNHATQLTGSGDIGTLRVAGAQQLSLNTTGQISSLEVTDKNAKFTLGTGAKLNNLKLPEGTKASDVIQNYDQVKGQIPNVNGTPNQDATAPASTGGGGGGGQTVVNGLLSSPTLTVWDQNDDETYNQGSDTFPAGSILQYNVNFIEGVKLSDFSSAEVTFYVGTHAVGKNTVKAAGFTDYQDAKGLTGYITAGPNKAEPDADPFWNVGAYSSDKKPTKAVFKLVKNGVMYLSTANFTPSTVKIPDLITSPTLNVWDQNAEKPYDQGTEHFPIGSILQYNVNFKDGFTLSDFSSAEVTFFVDGLEVGKNTVKAAGFADQADTKGLTGLITAGPNKADSVSDPFWNVGAYSSEQKPTKAVFKLVKDGVTYEETANFTPAL